MESKYTHTIEYHNLTAPRQIVPVIIELFSPHSVVDVGCGIGTFLHVFMENGIDDVFGIDGDWVNRELLTNNIPIEKFKPVNLENIVTLHRKFDVALCLEVAEHLPKESAVNLVTTLTQLSDIIVFSAAIPNQGGQNHINEQWPAYWENIFAQHGYKMHDILRYKFWDNPNVFWWYKQNIFIAAKEELFNHFNMLNSISKYPKNIVHPELFESVFRKNENLKRQVQATESELLRIQKGEKAFIFYINRMTRYVLRKIHLR